MHLIICKPLSFCIGRAKRPQQCALSLLGAVRIGY